MRWDITALKRHLLLCSSTAWVLRVYLEGQGDVVSKLIIPIITYMASLVILIINLLTKSP